MFNVAMHNISTGVFFLNSTGQLTRSPEWSILSHHQACTVAKAQADKHMCIYCVHDANNRVTKVFRPTLHGTYEAHDTGKDKPKVKKMKGEE